VTTSGGKELNYTANVTMRKGKGMSVELMLPDGKPLVLVGSTPGELMAKILKSARITEDNG